MYTHIMFYTLYCLVLGALALTNTFTESTWPIHVHDLNCSGNEKSIWGCPNNGLVGYLCSDHDDAAVKCLREFDLDSLIFIIISIASYNCYKMSVIMCL